MMQFTESLEVYQNVPWTGPHNENVAPLHPVYTQTPTGTGQGWRHPPKSLRKLSQCIVMNRAP